MWEDAPTSQKFERIGLWHWRHAVAVARDKSAKDLGAEWVRLR